MPPKIAQIRIDPIRGRRRERHRGSVLVAVLAIILLLSFLVTQFMNEALDDLEYRALFNEPTDLRAFTYGVLEASLATVQEVALIDDGKLYAPEQGWADPVAYAGLPVPEGWTVEVRIIDAGGKLPLNTMGAPLLERLFEETLDLGFSESRELSATLLDWIDADQERRLNGAESREYLDRDPPYKAADGPLQSLQELRLLDVWDEVFFDENGLPNERFAQLDAIVSVHNYGAVNLNAAPPEVIGLIALENGWNDDFLFDGLEEPYLKSPPEGADRAIAGVEVGLLRIEVTVRRGGIPFTVSALVEPAFGDSSGAVSTDAVAVETSGGPDDGAPKTGTEEEQDALEIPFNILQISEYESDRPGAPAARYSAMDID